DLICQQRRLTLACVHLLRIRRQPRPPLFPYTTLFRSKPTGIKERRVLNEELLLNGSVLQFLLQDQVVGKAIIENAVTRTQHGLRDRKSTRLNSTHLGISYAVFCLTNKKTFPMPQAPYR